MDRGRRGPVGHWPGFHAVFPAVDPVQNHEVQDRYPRLNRYAASKSSCRNHRPSTYHGGAVEPERQDHRPRIPLSGGRKRSKGHSGSDFCQPADIEMDFRRAAAIDLAGRDVEEAVQTSVNPKIIDIPPASSGRSTIDAVAKDGIMLRAKARVTVRTNINQLIGGATEETIVARVGEGIVSTIGSAETYKAVLQQPDQISKNVLASGLDAGSAFEILSIDISQIEVGENVGARLQADQAEADQRRARAHAEIRRALAVAREQEMVAQVQENRAKVVTAEAAVPEAIAAAFRTGQFSNQSKQGA